MSDYSSLMNIIWHYQNIIYHYSNLENRNLNSTNLFYRNPDRNFDRNFDRYINPINRYYPLRPRPPSTSRPSPLTRYDNELFNILNEPLNQTSTQSSRIPRNNQGIIEISLERNNTHNIINSNTTVELYSGTGEDTCSICREAFTDQSIVRKINRCNHQFHQSCIDTWFNNHLTCPHCRQNIRQETSREQSRQSRQSRQSGQSGQSESNLTNRIDSITNMIDSLTESMQNSV